MHIYVIVSTIYIGYLIYSHCTKKPVEWDDFIDESWTQFPLIHYLNKVNILNFFTEPEQFNRLCVLYDHEDIYDKMISIIENDKHIQEDYQNTLSFMTTKYFDYNNPINIPIELNGRIFNTNLQKLCVIKWFIMNDYFLFVE